MYGAQLRDILDYSIANSTESSGILLQYAIYEAASVLNVCKGDASVSY